MRIAELLIAIAEDLESSENEALLLSEYDENCLNVVASSLVKAAAILKKAANEVEAIEPAPESALTPEGLDEIAEFATALDESGDPMLKKQAALIDELLLTVAAPPNYVREKKAEEDARIETLRAKYQGNAETLKEENKTAQQQKDVAKSEYLETMPIHGHGLSQRGCPDHPGVGTYKLEGSDQTYVCSLDHKHYDFANGYKLMSGENVPGGSVSAQTGTGDERFYQPMFDSREGRLQSNR